MSRDHPSIIHGMLLIFLAGLGLSALRVGSFDHLRVVHSATVVLLLGAIVAARYRPGPEGGYWFGFAVFGWGYLLIAVAPWPWWGRDLGSGWKYVAPLYNPLIWTKELAGWAAETWRGRYRPPYPEDLSSAEARGAYLEAVENHRLQVLHIRGIAHMILAWLAGGAGGLLGWRLAGGRLRRRAEEGR